MTKKRIFRRTAPRFYECKVADVAYAMIFGAPRGGMWAWGVWGPNRFENSALAFSMESARKEANAALDKITGA
jgi:hypothetical protein